ncbi:unnamed protein product [Brassica oleracea var. botrytis]
MMRRRICVLPALDEMVDQDAYMKMVVANAKVFQTRRRSHVTC